MRAGLPYSMLVAVLLGPILMAGCGSTNRSAPVFDRAPPPRETVPVESRTTDARNPVATRRTANPAQPSAAKSPDAGATAASAQATASSPNRRTRAAERTVSDPDRGGDWRPEYYTVRKGDTLYSIALDFGHDYRDLAAWNDLADPAYIRIGQRLRLIPAAATDSGSRAAAVLPPATLPGTNGKRATSVGVPTFSDPMAYRAAYSEQAFMRLQGVIAGEVETAVLEPVPAQSKSMQPRPSQAPPAATPAPATSTPKPAKPPTAADERIKWEWPAPGELLYGFSEGPMRKGVAITGQPGQSVVSSAPGKVVYSGSGLRGYGNLIIVKHNATYLSVYAHNRQLLVSEGQTVAQGQKIAVMGEISNGRTALHFEIRRLGKPMDPLEYLPDRAS